MGNVAYPAYERKENEKAFAMLKYSQFDVSLELTAKAKGSHLCLFSGVVTVVWFEIYWSNYKKNFDNIKTNQG